MGVGWEGSEKGCRQHSQRILPSLWHLHDKIMGGPDGQVMAKLPLPEVPLSGFAKQSVTDILGKIGLLV